MEISTSHGYQFWGEILNRKRNKTEKSNEMSSLQSVLDRDVYAYLGEINIPSHHYQSSSFIGGFDVNPTLVVTLSSALLSST
jgi:hypothetical protein